jgi:hypothetical protein
LESFTFCLRVKFWTWDYRTVFESQSLELGFGNYKYRRVYFPKYDGQGIEYPPEAMILSPSAWQAVCISTGPEFLKITINNHILSAPVTNATAVTNLTDGITVGGLSERIFWPSVRLQHVEPRVGHGRGISVHGGL